MQKCLFIAPTGLIDHLVLDPLDGTYVDGETYEGCVAKYVDTDVDDATIKSTWHWTGVEFATHAPRNATAYVWDAENCVYKEPVVVKFLFVTADGLVAYTATPGFDGAYIDGETYGDCIARKTDTKVDNTTIISTWHWTGTEFATHDPNPDPAFVWDPVSFAYREPDNYLKMVADKAVIEVNRVAGQTITARYPLHRQANMMARYVELMALGRSSTQEALDIQTAWAWIASIREASNQANMEIQSAGDVGRIRALEQTFKNHYRADLPA